MQILSERFLQGEASTVSRLFVDGTKMGYVLEDKDRGLSADMDLARILSIKVKDHTAIPTGRYKVVLRWSPKFKRYLPWLLNVPGFQYIYMHSGNWIRETEGCLLNGLTYMKDKNSNKDYRTVSSKDAFNPVNDLIVAALKRKEEVWWEVKRVYSLAS